jgi:DNA-binding NarL/FixJ family response regulator
VLIVQLLSAVFFAGQIFASVLGLDIGPIDWAIYEWMEIGASVGLTAGLVFGTLALRHSLARTMRAETILADVSGAFMDMVHRRFEAWQFTPAERDVALFLIKGLSTSEIAQLRGTSEGTVKAQSNAIYRKSEVANRAQLVSLFIDDLMHDELPKPQASDA